MNQSIKKLASYMGIGALGLAASLPVHAGPLLSIGEHADLFFNGSVSLQADDNIFLDHTDEKSDLILIFSPGLELNVGRPPNANLVLYYREDIYRYDDHSSQNTNLSNVFLNANYEAPRYTVGLEGGYQELRQNTSAANIPGNFVDREDWRLGFTSEYVVSPKTSFGAGASYEEIKYKAANFEDRDIFSLPLDFYYELTPKLDLSLGYRFRNVDVRGPATTDSRDHFLNFGARGELAPKLDGQIRVGYQERNFKNQGGDRSTLSLLSNATWEATPKVRLTGEVLRDFDVGGEGNSLTRTGGRLRAAYDFSELWTGNAGLGYDRLSYDTGRRDDNYNASAGVSYIPTTYVTLSAGYVFRTNDSNLEQAEFDNHVFSVTATLRY